MSIEYPLRPELPWWAMIAAGLLSIVGGVLALAWPGITIVVLVIIAGIQLVLFGLMEIVAAAGVPTGAGLKILSVVFGVLAVLAGTVLWLQPVRNLAAVVAVVAAFWIAGGLLKTVAAVVEREPHFGWEVLVGLLSVGAGFVTLAWPGITLLVIALNVGVWMIVVGAIRIAVGWKLRGVSAEPRLAV